MRPIEVTTSISFVKLFKPLEFFRIECPHRFGQVSENLTISEINSFWLIIFKNPRKDVILIDIIMSSSTVFVQQHEIVEIRKCALDPSISIGKLRKLLDRIFDDLNSTINLIDKLDKRNESFFCVEANKFGITILKKNFNGIIHLTEFSEKDLLYVIQQD